MCELDTMGRTWRIGIGVSINHERVFLIFCIKQSSNHVLFWILLVADQNTQWGVRVKCRANWQHVWNINEITFKRRFNGIIIRFKWKAAVCWNDGGVSLCVLYRWICNYCMLKLHFWEHRQLSEEECVNLVKKNKKSTALLVFINKWTWVGQLRWWNYSELKMAAV